MSLFDTALPSTFAMNLLTALESRGHLNACRGGVPEMAIRGVWQLKKLVVYLCDYSGSSRGAREFVDVALPKFKSDNPQLEVVTELLRGRHPHFKGYYSNKNERVVDIKNRDLEDIVQQAMRLRNSTGRKVVKLSTRHVTFRPSVQGTWTPDMKF